jgi:penicillin amidase
MKLDDSILLAALRDSRAIEEICRSVGTSIAEFEAARDAFIRRHAPLMDRSITGPVAGVIEIKRDRAGVPHIYAGATTDLFFGLGVAMAQDRLWQMDRLRRRALGRQAEILGPGYVASDAAHLTIGIDRISERDAGAMEGATRMMVEAFVAGINRQIEIANSDLRSSSSCWTMRPSRSPCATSWPSVAASGGRSTGGSTGWPPRKRPACCRRRRCGRCI